MFIFKFIDYFKEINSVFILKSNKIYEKDIF